MVDDETLKKIKEAIANFTPTEDDIREVKYYKFEDMKKDPAQYKANGLGTLLPIVNNENNFLVIYVTHDDLLEIYSEEKVNTKEDSNIVGNSNLKHVATISKDSLKMIDDFLFMEHDAKGLGKKHLN
jgi:hypothetical protein